MITLRSRISFSLPVFRDGWTCFVLASAARAYLLFLLALAAIALIPGLFGMQGSVVQSGSMEPRISAGDLVLSTELPENLPVPLGGVVEFTSPAAAEPSGIEQTRLHRIVATNGDGTFVTAGDANGNVDSTTIEREQITGQARLLVPFVGLPGLWIGASDVAMLGLWAGLTVIALLIVAVASPLQVRATRQLHPTRHRLSSRRAHAITTLVLSIGLVAATAGILPTSGSQAAFTARTATVGSSWQVALAAASSKYYNYRAAIALDSPWAYFPADEAPSVFSAEDSSGNNRDATYSFSGVTTDNPGALLNETNRAITLNGTQAATFASPQPAIPGPGPFSIELWFKTGSGQGGQLASFGNNRSSTSSVFDRTIYLGTDGKLAFSANPKNSKVARSSVSYNDSVWHHVVATLGSAGMALYVDGAVVATNNNRVAGDYSGYWRVGGDNTANLPNRPANTFFDGSIDEVSIYNTTALSAARIAAHYDAAKVTTTGNYAVEIAKDAPSYYFHFEEGKAGVLADFSGHRQDTVYPASGVTYNVAGVLPKLNNRAAVFGGTDGSLIGKVTHVNPQTFSTEAWFTTTTTRGGQIIGLGSSNTMTSSSHDRHLYMTNAGRLVFGVYPGSVRTISSAAAYNDGNWHHVVATLSTAGMILYVDGKPVATNPAATSAEVYTGYWQIGAGNLSGWPDRPTSNHLDATLDEIAVYSSALSPTMVENHFRAR